MTHLPRGFLAAAACRLLGAVLLVGMVSGAGYAQEPKRGGKLIIAQDEGPDRIDPHGTNSSFQYSLITSSLYESLLKMDNEFGFHMRR